MKKMGSAFLAVAMIAGSLAMAMPAAHARDGGAIAAGVAGGLIGGALLGGAIAGAAAAPPPPPAYYAPGPAYVVEPACHWVRERFWDGYGWRFRRVQVCN
jgi:hypothetical protein